MRNFGKDDIPQFFITVTFKKDPAREPFKQIQKTLLKVFKKFDEHCSSFKLCMEWTLAGRIHYHASYFPTSKYHQQLLISKLKLYGFINNSIVKNYSDVRKYLDKDLKVVKQIFQAEGFDELHSSFFLLQKNLQGDILEETEQILEFVKKSKGPKKGPLDNI